MIEMMVRYLGPHLFRFLLHAFLMRSDREDLKTMGTFLLFWRDYFSIVIIIMVAFSKMEGLIGLSQYLIICGGRNRA